MKNYRVMSNEEHQTVLANYRQYGPDGVVGLTKQALEAIEEVDSMLEYKIQNFIHARSELTKYIEEAYLAPFKKEEKPNA